MRGANISTLKKRKDDDLTLTYSSIGTTHIGYADRFAGLTPWDGYLKLDRFWARGLQMGVQYVIVRWPPVWVRYAI